MLLTETVETGAEIDDRAADGRVKGASCAEMSEKQHSAAEVFIPSI